MPIQDILTNNRRWVAAKTAQDPAYFQHLATGQQPQYLFIGCSDSRVPAAGITGSEAGELFVHRNIANLVIHTDLSLLSVLQYAVEVLGVQDILVCGHYDCGGIAAASASKQYGLLDNWLVAIRDVVQQHETELLRIADDTLRLRRLVELNVAAQVQNLAKTTIIQNALRGARPPRLYGLVYDVADGRLKDLGVAAGISNGLDYIYATDAPDNGAAAAPEA